MRFLPLNTAPNLKFALVCKFNIYSKIIITGFGLFPALSKEPGKFEAPCSQ
jgi:hypothetical protein